MSTIHPKKEKLIHKCSKSKKCSKAFSQPYQLKMHEKIHQSDDQNRDDSIEECSLSERPLNQYFYTSRQQNFWHKSPENSQSSGYRIQKDHDGTRLNRSCDIKVDNADKMSSQPGASNGSITISSSVDGHVFIKNVVDIPLLDANEGDKENKAEEISRYAVKSDKDVTGGRLNGDDEVIHILQTDPDTPVHLILSSGEKVEGKFAQRTIAIDDQNSKSPNILRDGYQMRDIQNKNDTSSIIDVNEICEPLWFKSEDNRVPDAIVVAVESDIMSSDQPPNKNVSHVFKCQFCAKQFSSKKTQSQHERNVHSSGGIHECRVCSKLFASLQYLKEHSKIHSEKLRYKCVGYDDTCDRVFRSAKDLKRHIRGVHSG